MGKQKKDFKKMTEMQILRNALFDEIARVKRGTTSLEDTHAIVKTANAIIATYNTELKAAELLIDAQTLGADTVKISIFNEDTEKKFIDYKAKDEDM